MRGGVQETLLEGEQKEKRAGVRPKKEKCYDFVEMFSGRGRLSRAMAREMKAQVQNFDKARQGNKKWASKPSGKQLK